MRSRSTGSESIASVRSAADSIGDLFSGALGAVEGQLGTKSETVPPLTCENVVPPREFEIDNGHARRCRLSPSHSASSQVSGRILLQPISAGLTQTKAVSR